MRCKWLRGQPRVGGGSRWEVGGATEHGMDTGVSTVPKRTELNFVRQLKIKIKFPWHRQVHLCRVWFDLTKKLYELLRALFIVGNLISKYFQKLQSHLINITLLMKMCFYQPNRPGKFDWFLQIELIITDM